MVWTAAIGCDTESEGCRCLAWVGADAEVVHLDAPGISFAHARMSTAPNAPDTQSKHRQEQRTAEVVTKLRSRSKSARRYANLLLAAVAALVLFGLIKFGVVDDLTLQMRLRSGESVLKLIPDQLKQQIRDAEAARNERQLRLTAAEERAAANGGSSAEIADLHIQLERIEAVLKQLRTQYQAVTEGKLVSGPFLEQLSKDAAAGQAWITTTALRIGVLLLLFFLAQLFVSVYRFLMRAANHYDAAADALELLEPPVDVSTFVQLAHSLRPDADFGREVRTLPQEVVDILAAAKK